MFKLLLPLFFIGSIALAQSSAESENKVKKNYLEDIFIWKISDELKLSVSEEKKFSETIKELNKKKADLNHRIQLGIETLTANASEADLKQQRKLLVQYNELALQEFDAVKKIFGTAKFTQYLKLKNELNNKMKSILIGDKAPAGDARTSSDRSLPKPKVIIEK